LRELPEEDRRKSNLTDKQLGLIAEHVGEYGEHAAAKRAGFLKGDVLIEVDGRSDRFSESQLLGYLVQNRMPGARIPVTVLRKGERVKLELPMQ